MKSHLKYIFCVYLTLFSGYLLSADFDVTTTLDGIDETPGDGVCKTVDDECTLRAAIMESNALIGKNSIFLPNGNYSLTEGGINEDEAFSGDLDITDDIDIIGESEEGTVIDGNSYKYRIFHVLLTTEKKSPKVSISNLTLKNGIEDHLGALITSFGHLTLTNITLTEASPIARALVQISGSLTFESSNVKNNVLGVLAVASEVTQYPRPKDVGLQKPPRRGPSCPS